MQARRGERYKSGPGGATRALGLAGNTRMPPPDRARTWQDCDGTAGWLQSGGV